MIRALDLCSGIGGFRVGAEESVYGDNFKFVAFSDSDPYANKAYEFVYDTKGEILLGDIQVHTRLTHELEHIGLLPDNDERTKKINESIPDIDFLFAGFPCQPHSLMGNRKGNNDHRGNIFYDIVELLKAKNPTYFILENVKAITSVNDGRFFEEIEHTLTTVLGYDMRIWFLNASDFGVPQTRRRVFFVGSRENNLPDEPPPVINLSNAIFPTTWHLLEKNADEKYFLSENILKTILKDEHKGYKRKAEINKLIARPLCKSMHKMHRASQDNYYSTDFIEGVYNEHLGEVTYNKIPEPKIRRITPREAFRIQSFPERIIDRLLELGFSDTRLYMLAGNAVPPLMVKSVLDHILIQPTNA